MSAPASTRSRLCATALARKNMIDIFYLYLVTYQYSGSIMADAA
jgi:hypothetical protein